MGFLWYKRILRKETDMYVLRKKYIFKDLNVCTLGVSIFEYWVNIIETCINFCILVGKQKY